MEKILTRVADIIGNNAGHGINHIAAVLVNLNQMIAADKELSHAQITIITLAAILHDVDDHKFFKGTSNARTILAESEFSELTEVVMFCVDCVGYSTNQNNFPKSVPAKFDMYGFNRQYFNETGKFADTDMWILYPRFADRLEAIDLQRALEFGRSLKRLDYNDETPRILSTEDFENVNFAEREQKYIANGCRSLPEHNTSMDHIYDKCMNLVNMETKNEWCKKEKLARHYKLMNDIVEFWIAQI